MRCASVFEHYEVIMRKLRTTWFILLFLVIFSQTAAAAVPIITVDELRPGMHGIAKTVIRGADIDTFDVEILGVTGSQAEGHSILVKASGSLIERSGGIAQGMSGSPVYIDGRLAGAVAYGKAFSDPDYCFLTPIEEMLKMFEKTDARSSPFLPKNSPLMASGFTAEGMKYLTEKLSPLDLKPLAVPSGQREIDGVQLEPGSSVGVELIRGDIRLGAIGTVTWMDEEGRILAFGHPFLQRGKADFFMTNAWIFASIPNVESSYKVGALGKTVGTVNQDRAAGIAGKIDQYPKIIPMFVSVTDLDRGINKSAALQLVTDEMLVPVLLDVACYNTVNATTDRNGGGTARVNFRISARGENTGEITIERENMFYNPSNLAKAINGELVYVGDMLMNNKFEKVTIFDVNVNVEAGSACNVAEISGARVKSGKVKAGENITVEVEFQPYRSEKFSREYEFKVPAGSKPGPMSLLVRGGGASTWLATVLQKQQTEEAAPKLRDKKTLKDFLQDFKDYDKNNEIVIDIMPGTASAAQTSPSDKTAAAEQGAMTVKGLFKGSKAKQKYPVDFIVDGESEITVEVIN